VTDDSGVLNVCCPYSSRDEITSAMRKTAEEVYQADGDVS
jgi:undecaprenyl pyrophosphate synthase